MNMEISKLCWCILIDFFGIVIVYVNQRLYNSEVILVLFYYFDFYNKILMVNFVID